MSCVYEPSGWACIRKLCWGPVPDPVVHPPSSVAAGVKVAVADKTRPCDHVTDRSARSGCIGVGGGRRRVERHRGRRGRERGLERRGRRRSRTALIGVSGDDLLRRDRHRQRRGPCCCTSSSYPGRSRPRHVERVLSPRGEPRRSSPCPSTPAAPLSRERPLHRQRCLGRAPQYGVTANDERGASGDAPTVQCTVAFFPPAAASPMVGASGTWVSTCVKPFGVTW